MAIRVIAGDMQFLAGEFNGDVIWKFNIRFIDDNALASGENRPKNKSISFCQRQHSNWHFLFVADGNRKGKDLPDRLSILR